jgi:UPF0755 protein
MFKKIVLVALVLGGISLFVVKDKIGLYFAGNKKSINNTEVIFIYKDTTGLNALATILFEKKVIDDIESFIKVGEYKNLNYNRLAIGKYIILPHTNYKTLLNGFTLNSNGNGNAEVEVNVTFNNCKTIEQMVGKIAKCIMVDSTSLVSFLYNDEVLNKYGFTAAQLPSLFLPNTYKMYYDTDEAAFVARMAKEFRDFWTTERKAKMQQIGLKSPSEVVTLASIVYSEQGRIESEWPIIAGLYLNRIQKGIRLQSDPTFKFCWGDQLDDVQRLLHVHRDIDCAYNTYKINGLPPGPICIPPSKVVDAVLNRTKVDYIFMCAKADYSGEHNFAVSGSAHERNAVVFQRWLAQELKKKKK